MNEVPEHDQPVEARRRWRRRVPVVQQLTPTECSAAVLAMVLRYHGRWVSLDQCRERLQPGREGATAFALAEAARSFGLRVHSYSVPQTEMLRGLPLPAVAHWEFQHFVVIERVGRRRVWIVDPALGRRSLSYAEFDRSFTGVCLTLTPGYHFAADPSGRRAERVLRHRLVRYLVRTPGLLPRLGEVLIVSALLQLLGLAYPVFTKLIIDVALPQGSLSLLPLLVLAVAAWAVAYALAGFLRSAVLLVVRTRLDLQLMLGFFEHMLSLPYRFLQQRTSGDLLMRLTSNNVLRELLTSQAVSVVLDAALVLFYLAILGAYDRGFALLAAALGAGQVALGLLPARLLRRLAQADLEAQAQAQGYLVEALAGVTHLKAAGVEDAALDRWSSLFMRQLDVGLRRGQLAATLDSVMGTARQLAPVALLGYGASLVIGGTMSLGTMLALLALSASFLGPLGSLVTTLQGLSLFRAHFERILDVLSAKPEQEADGPHHRGELAGALELRGVTFRYSAQAPPAVEDVSLDIRPGQKVALVGPSGSGKSTLLKMMLGLYEPEQGSVKWDARDLGAWDRWALRRQIGVVTQESFLFSGSLRENVAFGQAQIAIEDVERAVRTAALDDDVETLSSGYETWIGEGGSALSGGQRQRVALARALAGKPRVLLLDEPTSHLDAVTERRIADRLADFRGTQIIVAHRLSTVRDADLIIVLDRGAVVERGGHEELLAAGGAYAQLVSKQRDVPD